MKYLVLDMHEILPNSRLNLESLVGRPAGCAPRGVWQGMTRRNSYSIPTSYNVARRRAGRALWAVAIFTQRVNLNAAHYQQQINRLTLLTSGQLRILG